MKKTLAVTGVVAVLVLIYFVVLGQVSHSGKAAGLLDGELSPCPDKPNCVCSENHQDAAHYVEPFSISDIPVADALQSLHRIIDDIGGTVETTRADYISATFSSSLFGFIDDVEIRVDATAEVIHVRSASRVGYRDFDTNRKRVAQIRQRFRPQAARSQTNK